MAIASRLKDWVVMTEEKMATRLNEGGSGDWGKQVAISTRLLNEVLMTGRGGGGGGGSSSYTAEGRGSVERGERCIQATARDQGQGQGRY